MTSEAIDPLGRDELINTAYEALMEQMLREGTPLTDVVPTHTRQLLRIVDYMISRRLLEHSERLIRNKPRARCSPKAKSKHQCGWYVSPGGACVHYINIDSWPVTMCGKVLANPSRSVSKIGRCERCKEPKKDRRWSR